MTLDCTLNTKTRRKIETRINSNGTSFQDCQENCNVIFENSGIKSKTRTNRPARTRTRKRQTRTVTRAKSRTTSTSVTKTRTKSTTKPQSSSTSEDARNCDCYCSMLHNPCLAPATGIIIINIIILLCNYYAIMILSSFALY